MVESLRYALMDLVPVTADVYLRLFERQNEAVWPAQLPAVAIACFVLYRALIGRIRFIGLLLAVLWVWVGITFHLNLYAGLTWTATYFGYAFLLQSLLLLVWEGWTFGRPPAPPPRGALKFGGGLAGFAVAGYPFLAPLLGRPWTGAELVGIAPDPTALTTLGLVLVLPGPRWFLAVIPFLWCLVSGLNSWILGLYGGMIPLLVALVIVIVAPFFDR